MKLDYVGALEVVSVSALYYFCCLCAQWEVSVFTTDVITASPSFCNFLSVSRPLKGRKQVSCLAIEHTAGVDESRC